MSQIDRLFKGVDVINVGIKFFKDEIVRQRSRAVQVDWRFPGGGNVEVIGALDRLATASNTERIEAVNQQAVERIVNSRPMPVGFGPAIEVVRGMTRKTILHAGPPITWQRMNGAMKGAVTGALVLEGLATDLVDAAQLAASGEIRFAPCHEFG